MKIKIIDLLNKIANGEDVPEEIIYNGKTYKYVEGRKDNWKYQRIENGKSVGLLEDNIYFSLNDEVEMIEELKKIEKLKAKYTSEVGKLELANKINELIDAVNELKRNK